MNAAARDEAPRGPADAASRKPLVLVVEDERTQRMILRAALERDGFEVEEAVDGLDGLRAYDAVRPDIVLLDVRMPGMDGFATCAALRRRPQAERLPILMLTILNDLESINRAYEAGATDFITKPVAWPVLGHRLRYMLRASKAFNELARSEAELLLRVAERTSELHASNAELEAFTYSVSHDLRAPLRAIRGYAELLRGSGKEQERELIEQIRGHTARMSAMIDDMLRLSHLARGNGLALQHDVDLHAIAARTIEGLRADYPLSDIRLGALARANCDPGLMQQVFENLIGNALKYSAKKDRPEIEIGQHGTAAGGVIYVRDNGIGFDQAQAQTLFGAFRRFHMESDYPGTGVGLAIVKRIIDRHGGRIWAESAPNQGACFYFTLGGAADAQNPPTR